LLVIAGEIPLVGDSTILHQFETIQTKHISKKYPSKTQTRSQEFPDISTSSIHWFPLVPSQDKAPSPRPRAPLRLGASVSVPQLRATVEVRPRTSWRSHGCWEEIPMYPND
jgi:hypothetical protein